MARGSKKKEEPVLLGMESEGSSPTEAPLPGNPLLPTSRPQKKLTRAFAVKVRALTAQGKSPDEIAALLHATPEVVARAIAQGDRAESVPHAAPLGSAAAMGTPPPPTPPPPTADQLVSMLCAAVAFGSRIGGWVLGRYHRKMPDPVFMKQVCTVPKEEREGLETLAPYAVQAFPGMAQRSGPVMVWSFFGAAIFMLGTRIAIIHFIIKQEKQRESDERSNVVRGHDRNRQDARRARGPEDHRNAEGDSGPGRVSPSLGDSNGKGFKQGAGRGSLDARFG